MPENEEKKEGAAPAEVKLAEFELKEIKRKVAAVNQLKLQAETLERDRVAYLSDVLVSHGLDPAKIWDVSLETGLVTEHKPAGQ